ncbi:MAG: diaminohydroxyphosphoribosylaminopyrimidine deaminase [Cognaticolwellia sp.]|jgi:diaminohydroxyphosphoribosylaminopyrimidine deaminase/5-amino-6-(5-phosphoribosylamino)uracil reductase
MPTRTPTAVWTRLLALSRGGAVRADPAWGADQLRAWQRLEPLARGTEWTVAHLAQSLDGRIAMHCGASQWISGPEDLAHTHSLRALSDAVLVGAATATLDDPALTVRRVSGPHPTRVLVDPSGSVPSSHQLLSDGKAPTLWLTGADVERELPDFVERVTVPVTGMLSAKFLLELLAARGLRRVFIEGGGVTVSRFLEEGCLNRLHLVVAPMIIGSGRPSLVLPALDTLEQALRPETRVFPLGQDILYDLVFS